MHTRRKCLRRPADFTPCISSSVSCRKNEILMVSLLSILWQHCRFICMPAQVWRVNRAERSNRESNLCVLEAAVISRPALFIFQDMKTHPYSRRQHKATQSTPDSQHQYQTLWFIRWFSYCNSMEYRFICYVYVCFMFYVRMFIPADWCISLSLKKLIAHNKCQSGVQ